MEDILVQPIGVVKDVVVASNEQLKQGVTASIEVFPKFAPGLVGIERSTHVMVVGWLHKAERNVLQVRRPRYVGLDVMRGVFACRTPVRPNPIGVTTVKLIGIKGNLLRVDGLDMADGTPVIDIKPHSPGFDSAFSARSARDLSRLADADAQVALRGMLREAENFHGERCAGLVLGAKIIYAVMNHFVIAQKDPRLQVGVGEDGCVADAVQALTGATFGNKRLGCSPTKAFEFRLDQRVLRFWPRDVGGRRVDELIDAALIDLCAVEELASAEIYTAPNT